MGFFCKYFFWIVGLVLVELRYYWKDIMSFFLKGMYLVFLNCKIYYFICLEGGGCVNVLILNLNLVNDCCLIKIIIILV